MKQTGRHTKYRAGRAGHSQANTTVATIEYSTEMKQTGRHTKERINKARVAIGSLNEVK